MGVGKMGVGKMAPNRSVSSIAQCSFARDGPLSGLESHGSVSSVAQCSFARDRPLSGPAGVSWVSLTCCAMLICWRRLVLWSEISDANALSCNPKPSPAGQQTAKHDWLYPFLSVSLTVPPFVERFQQRDDLSR